MTGSALKTFRWWPVDGGRHAIPGELRVGDTGQTLCLHPVTVAADEPTKSQWLWSTCSTCYEAARGYTHVSRAGYWPVLPAQRGQVGR